MAGGRMKERAMRERGIIFSTPMVRALLAGTKTQTRRIVKITHRTPGLAACLQPADPEWIRPKAAAELCPYGKRGDRLWVRESFQPLLANDTDWREADYQTGRGYSIGYPATDGVQEFYDIHEDRAFCDRVKPSIHMPRWASRITLEITDVRIERLQDISETDAEAEGVDRIRAQVPLHRDAYRLQWEDIHGLGAWEANPWVWVVAFRRVDGAGEDGEAG